MKYFKAYPSPLGALIMVSDGEALTGLAFGFDRKVPENVVKMECGIFEATGKWLDIYFQGKCPDFLPKLSLHGTDFQMEVWQILLQIPYGEVITYGEIAMKIARKRGIAKMSAQAIGGAVGRNPVSILVPCHRVIGKNGSMIGYGGGLERKVALLRLEGRK